MKDQIVKLFDGDQMNALENRYSIEINGLSYFYSGKSLTESSLSNVGLEDEELGELCSKFDISTSRFVDDFFLDINGLECFAKQVNLKEKQFFAITSFGEKQPMRFQLYLHGIWVVS